LINCTAPICAGSSKDRLSRRTCWWKTCSSRLSSTNKRLAQVTWDKKSLVPTEPLSRLILFGKERRLIHSQQGRNAQVATTDISPVARSRAETKPISSTHVGASQGTTTTQSGNANRPLGNVDGSDPFGRRNNQR